MAIPKFPYLSTGSWVEVINPENPFFGRLGRVAIGGKFTCEVDFAEIDGTTTRKAFVNRSLQKHEPPCQIKVGSGVVVRGQSCLYYMRRGVVKHLIAGNEIALVDFGGRWKDEAGNIHEITVQIHTSDLNLLDGTASAGSMGGDARGRSAQG